VLVGELLHDSYGVDDDLGAAHSDAELSDRRERLVAREWLSTGLDKLAAAWHVPRPRAVPGGVDHVR
jgi:hypothetical protein